MTLYIITLEPIEIRYSKQWYHYWKQEFSKYFNVEYIDGTFMSDVIEKGKFLDINKTNIWKAEQVNRISELFMNNKIKNDDSFIFMDAWHFGIIALKYMIQLNDMKCKIFGYWHAGTYDPYDFITQKGLQYWASESEISWFKALDVSFVSTKFHKELILKKYKGKINSEKIYVVGFPMDWKKEINSKVGEVVSYSSFVSGKENIIVFPHRLDEEKCPEVFDKISKHFPQYKFIKTLEVTRNKQEYYSLLKKAKIVFSASKQETFGIGTVEALMLNCVPVVPNRLSYNELYNGIFKYSDLNVAIKRIKHFMNHYGDKHIIDYINENKEQIMKQSLDSISKMAKIIKVKNGNNIK